jgi:L-histidine N-alpha-methyltransferase
MDPGRRRRELADDVTEGLGSSPKTLPPKYFYDERGSELFVQITDLPEYYQTRTERRLLEEHADSLVEEAAPRALVEYGSGSAGKTRILLDAMAAADRLRGYAPIDVSPQPVGSVSREVAADYPGTTVVGVVADFEKPIALPFADRPRLVAFLGSTIGNFRQEEAAAFLARTRAELGPEDAFLCGFDLVKDRERLVAAYDDASGVTAEFNRNVLRVINRELDADFDPAAFRHEARWDEERARIEMHLVSERSQEVSIRELGSTVPFREGESVRTELSHKYTRETAAGLLREGGFRLARWETDPKEWFALGLARPEG